MNLSIFIYIIYLTLFFFKNNNNNFYNFIIFKLYEVKGLKIYNLVNKMEIILINLFMNIFAIIARAF